MFTEHFVGKNNLEMLLCTLTYLNFFLAVPKKNKEP